MQKYWIHIFKIFLDLKWSTQLTLTIHDWLNSKIMLETLWKWNQIFYVLTLWQGSAFARKTFKHLSLINFVGVIKQLFKKALSTNIKALFLSVRISIYYIYLFYISINYIYKCCIYELYDTNCVINIALNYLKCNTLRRYISYCLNFVL